MCDIRDIITFKLKLHKSWYICIIHQSRSIIKHAWTYLIFANEHIDNVVSTLINVVKLDVENNNIVSTLSNVVNINVEKSNIDSALFNIKNFNADKHNVVSTLIWHWLTSQRHVNLKTTLKQRWNLCCKNKVIFEDFFDIASCLWYLWCEKYLFVFNFS